MSGEKRERGTEETDPSFFVLFCPHETTRRQLTSGRRWHGHHGHIILGRSAFAFGAGASVSVPPSPRQPRPLPSGCKSRGCRRRGHQEARAPRAQWPVAVASECASTGTPRRRTLATFCSDPGMACGVGVVSCHRLCCLHLGARGSGEGCSVPCPRMAGSLYRSRALHRRAPACAHKGHQRIISVCISTIVFYTLHWLVGACACSCKIPFLYEH